MISAAKQLQEKCQNQNSSLYTAHVDLTKAFDTVNRTGIFVNNGEIWLPTKIHQHGTSISWLHAAPRSWWRQSISFLWSHQWCQARLCSGPNVFQLDVHSYADRCHLVKWSRHWHQIPYGWGSSTCSVWEWRPRSTLKTERLYVCRWLLPKCINRDLHANKSEQVFRLLWQLWFDNKLQENICHVPTGTKQLLHWAQHLHQNWAPQSWRIVYIYSMVAHYQEITTLAMKISLA